jgi:hypothetical protein
MIPDSQKVSLMRGPIRLHSASNLCENEMEYDEQQSERNPQELIGNNNSEQRWQNNAAPGEGHAR